MGSKTGLSSALAFPLDLGARPLCRRLRGRGCANCHEDGGVSGVSSSCGARGGFLPRHNEDLREPLVRRQGSQVSMRVARVKSLMPSSHLILCRPLLLLPPIPPSTGASLVAQLVKTPPAMQETWVRSLGWEDPLKGGAGRDWGQEKKGTTEDEMAG